MSTLFGEEREYKGLGSAVARGKRKIRIGITTETGDTVMGTLVSHELSKGDTPLLLGLQAQATLGLKKDVRSGTCTLDDEAVQMYKMRDSGLRALCISEVNAAGSGSAPGGGETLLDCY